MPRVTTSTGVIIDSDALAAPTLTEYAAARGLSTIAAAVATHPSEVAEYVLIENQQVIYANQCGDAVWAHIDILAMTRGRGE